MSKIDLHIHTNASDGKYSPAEVVRQAVEHGLTVIAITDHDTVDGIVPALNAAKASSNLRVIPGVEISTETSSGETHILGYFIDYYDNQLKTTLELMRNSRRYRAQKMIAKLHNLGVHIDWRRVQEIAGSGAIGRPHIAQAMLEKGYIASLKEAFAKYIGRDCPAYVEREKITPVEAVQLIVKASGLPVLAHPTTMDHPETTIAELKEAGLVGVEAYYGNYTAEEADKLSALAEKHHLIITGGSDYHGLDIINEPMLGTVNVPDRTAEQLFALAEKHGVKMVL